MAETEENICTGKIWHRQDTVINQKILMAET
jgi:hypothetical protein